MKGVRLVPYRLPEILNASEIIVVEGERDVETLVGLGFCGATTNAMGAGKWRREYSQHLKGKGIYLIPDNDEPGRSHMNQVALSLKGLAKFIRPVILPGLEAGGDVSDFIAQFPDKNKAVEALSGLMAEAPEWKPSKAEAEKDVANARTCEDLHAFFTRGIEYLWRSHVVRGMPVMVNAREGVGKTTICLGIGKEILNTHPEGFVVWVACEGQLLNTLNQAREIGLADHDRFRIAELAQGDFLFRLDRQDHLKKFAGLIERMSGEAPVLAVFIDSIRGMTGFGDNDSEVGNVMMAVNSLVCDKHGAALIYIDHFKKGKTAQDDPHSLLDKAVGSTAKTSAVRLVLSVLPASKFKRTLREAKNNIGRPAPELDVLKTKGRLVFQEAKRKTEQTMREQAEGLLFDLFAERRKIPANEIADEGEKQGISFDTLKKVKETLGIESMKEVERWYWVWTALI